MKENQIGEKLRKLRGDRTLQAVANDTGIGPTALSNYESGYRIPRDKAKFILAQYYHANLEDLFFAQYSTDCRDTANAS